MPRVSPFPPYDLKEALIIAQTIWEHNAGRPMRRLTIFDILKRSPGSGTSRQLVTASSGYGLTQGGFAAETISLTDRGQAIAQRNDPQAKLDAVLGVPVFAKFFDNYRNSVIPSTNAAIDFLKGQGLQDQAARSCLDVLLKTGEQVELIQEISGTKRVVSPEHALETLAKTAPLGPQALIAPQPAAHAPAAMAAEAAQPLPTVHIDIQIHIASDAKPDQIDQIFASMAKHLYKRG